MLQELRIRDLAIIDDLRVEFGPGLNVLSGETGAGKSILVDALALATGGRASADLVRAGAQSAVVEAAFRIDARPDIRERLESLGLEAEEELIVRRTIAPGGKSRAFLNGSPLTQGMLSQALEGLVEIDGQHEHQRLLKPETQLALLDRAARLQELCSEVGGILRRWRELAGEGESLRLSEEERLRQIDYLGFQITEISEADPQPGEDAQLAAERGRLANAGRLAESAGGAEALLYSGEGAVVESLGRAAAALGEAARIDSALGESAARIEGAQREIEDVATALRGYAEGIVFDPDRLADVDTRLQTLKGLTRKYGPGIEDVRAALALARERLAGFEAGDERLTKIDAECEALRETGMAKARKLSVARVRAGKALSRKIQAELGALGMLKAAFEVEVSEEVLPVPGFGERGKDRVVFNFSANPGEPSRALARIASGGELSRTMLAIRNILFDAELPGVLVFDEADAGVGGKVADAVGERLSDLASKHQVLCLTHLPQIAARGDRHLRVSKMSLGGRTVARLAAVEGAARVEEIARMSGGARISEPTRAHARDLLSRARPGGPWDGKIRNNNK